MNCIEFKGILKRYRNGIVALDHLNLSVKSGILFGILGPNGAGKSTLINILAGIVRKDAGDIFVLGNKIDFRNNAYKKYIGFSLEKPHYIDKLTPDEYLFFVGILYGLDRTLARFRVDELIEFFNMESHRHVWIKKCSNGMKKKISLAAALIHTPQILILDETLEGIDPISSSIIKDNLRFMVAKGISVLLTSHVLETVENICDEIVIIDQGKSIFQEKISIIRNKKVQNFEGKNFDDIFIEIVQKSKNNNDNSSSKLSWL
ncbi:MAG: ABC transporter ATP-binding protein [Nitrosopumilaceae archaeon]|nr:ABC transporter ATP-binding protein [Nitrosopumilaceae archaeon]